ncbi:MAG TPA: ABC transporter substrate-binding protein [Candidatus Udaeobacter sp.]|jgi:ABC-type nitrate/sulfonate/bicarbonate transport system substrate-binding protein|nr:ABC transporter substrate-binding protein [Candidatus Udaeobacter sp.]
MKESLVILSIVFLFQMPSHAADKIRITVSGLSGQFMTFPLAQKRGFLKEEGIETEIIRITGAASRTALGSGEVDYGTGLGSNIGGAITGLQIKVVACYVPAPVLALVTRPEFKSVQELKGKTVGILVFGGVAHFAARVMAKHFGLDPEKDMKFIAIGPVEARFAALTQGLIDATLLAPPLDYEAKKRGFNVLARADEILIFPETGLVSGVKKIQERPDEIKRVIRAGIKAYRYIRGNRDGTIQFIMEWLKVNREIATATYDGVAKVYNDDINMCEKGLRLVVDETKKTMKITRDIPLSEIADLSILREAQRELGTK